MFDGHPVIKEINPTRSSNAMRFFNESETRREINAALNSDFIPMAERVVFFFYYYYHFFW